MTDTELIKKSAFESNIESLLEQIFETGFQAGYEEAVSQMRYKLEDMESEE